jgi:hypothetical protein
MVGKAAAFSLTDNHPVRIFGLPKQMLLEVYLQLRYWLSANVTTQFRILSKPCSVIRDVTLQTVQLMQNARDKSSRDTRAVFSTPILVHLLTYTSYIFLTSWTRRMREKFPHAADCRTLHSQRLDCHLHPSRCVHTHSLSHIVHKITYP